MNQLDLNLSRKLRDDGMQLALEHAESESEDWGEVAYAFLLRFVMFHAYPFISEDVSDSSKEDPTFPQPPTDRAWGAIYRRAVKNGLIHQVGAGRSRRRHASICPLWRRGAC
jgi:hypothetical protein